jgi:hypothetical protein
MMDLLETKAVPPEPELSPTALWLALTAVPRPFKIVDVPRNDPATGKSVGQIAIWPLTQEEQMICNAEADRFAKALLKDAQKRDEVNFGYEHTFGNDNAIQILFRACRDPKDLSRAAFPSTALMRRKLSSDEVSALFKLYIMVQVELGPIIRGMSDEEREALVRRIEEGGSAFPFSLLSLETQVTLLRFMASKLVGFWTGTTSVGSRHDERTDASSMDPTEAPDDLPPLSAPDE